GGHGRHAVEQGEPCGAFPAPGRAGRRRRGAAVAAGPADPDAGVSDGTAPRCGEFVTRTQFSKYIDNSLIRIMIPHQDRVPALRRPHLARGHSRTDPESTAMTTFPSHAPSRRSRLARAVAAAIALGASAGVALAQDTTAPAGAADTDMVELDHVIVTANKRQE